MKILKKVLLVALILVAITAIIGWMMPGTAKLERSLVMKGSANAIYDQVNTLKNWEKWSPWFKMDPNQKVTYGELASGPGAYYSWVGEKTGEGTITIAEAVAGQLIKTNLAFKGQGDAKSDFIFAKEGEGTKVTWTFESEIGGNPFGRIFWGTVGKSMVGQSFEEGLRSLDELTANMKETGSAGSNIQVDVRQVPETHYLFIHDSASIATIGQKLGEGFGKIMSVVQKQGLEPAGAPFGIYYTESTTNLDIDICIPVNKAGKEDGTVKVGLYKGGNMVIASFYGAYEQTPAGHEAAGAYIGKNGKKVIGAPWERYVTDPMMEKDTAKWLTEICYPVE